MSAQFSKLYLVLVIVAVLSGLAGCRGDDPVSPDPGGIHGPELPFPTTPDSLVVLYQTALAEMDTALYPALLAPDFRYNFSALDTAANQLTTDYMTRAEALQAAGNMFDGVDVTNSLGHRIPGVTRIQVFQFDREEAWVTAGSETPYPGTQVARHFVRIHLERDFGIPTMSIIGDLEVYARAIERTDNQGNTRTGYQLAGLVDPSVMVTAGAKENGIYSWGMGFFLYLDNLPPSVSLQARDTGTFPLPGFELDATGSGDVDSGLHPQAYRWRAAADSNWTTWRSAPLMRFVYEDTGAVVMGLEVRDRWGLSTTAEVGATIPAAALSFPDSPDQLMANLRTVFDNQVVSLIDDLLAADHVTYLDSTATFAYPAMGGTLAREDELAALGRIFSGDDVTDPEGEIIPGVGLISVTSLVKQGDWSVATGEDRVPGAQHATFNLNVFVHRWSGDDLTVDGSVDFYAVARDSLVDGEVRDYWQLIAQDDFGPTTPGTGALSWSGFKAMYRAPSSRSRK